MKKAFTLIELLIVVAIIAILAAIAVPNFLEAQTRAKVARVQSDMRTYSTAIGTYQIDHSTYPLWYSSEAARPEGKPTGITQNINNAIAIANNMQGNDLTRSNQVPTFAYKAGTGTGATAVPPVSLTTPVQYLNSYVTDSMAPTKNMTFGYVAGPAYMLFSAGPDLNYDLWYGDSNSNSHKAAEVIVFAGQSLPSPYLIVGPGGGNPPTGAPAAKNAFTYDSSNGTQSAGDVYRTQ